MLTQDNLSDLLGALGFEKKGAIHRKLFGAAILEVNFTKKEITFTAPLPEHMQRTWKLLDWKEGDVPEDPFETIR